jgi:hypothetical protein
MKTVRTRWLLLAVALAALSISWTLWKRSQREPVKMAVESPSFQSIRKQLSLEISKDRLSIDDPITLTITFKNIDHTELPVTKWKIQDGRGQPSFFVSINTSSFGVMPSSERNPDRYELVKDTEQRGKQNYSVVHRIAPGETDVTTWNGTLRQLMNMSPTTSVGNRGDLSIRVSYLDKPNSVNSEWVRLRLVR